MDYSPRYPQPFTLWEASQLDVPIITEEIARLQNSLVHLKRTQEGLEEAISESRDPDFVQALEENTSVIGSQEERISMLRMALVQKGIPVEAHCAAGTQPPPTTEAAAVTPESQLEPSIPSTAIQNGVTPRGERETDTPMQTDDDGIDL